MKVTVEFILKNQDSVKSTIEDSELGAPVEEYIAEQYGSGACAIRGIVVPWDNVLCITVNRDE